MPRVEILSISTRLLFRRKRVDAFAFSFYYCDGATVSAALQLLPLEQREVLVARLWGGLTFEQIAELNGTSSSSTHRLYHAGLAALRERLRVSCPNSPSNPI